MRHKGLSLRYAKALFNLGVQEKTLGRFREELLRLQEIFQTDRNILILLGAREVSLTKRNAILEGLMQHFLISPQVQNFMKLLLERGRMSIFYFIVSAFESLVLDSENKVVAKARVASMEAYEKSKSELQKVLEKITGKGVTLKVEEDRSLIGGLSIQIKDTVYDASILGELNKMRESFTLMDG